MNELTAEFIEAQKKIARRETAPEHDEAKGECFVPYEWWGGHADDTYYGGERDGETMKAREFLTALGIDFGPIETDDD